MAEQRKGGKRPAGGVGNLVGGGPSVVGTTGAMRARDVSRPRAEDEARAEQRVVIRHAPPRDADAPQAQRKDS